MKTATPGRNLEKVILSMEYDNGVPSPESWDLAWRLERFNKVQLQFSPVDSRLFDACGNPNTANKELVDKLSAGSAFPLRYVTGYFRSYWAINTEGPKSQRGGKYRTGLLLWDYSPNILSTSYKSRKIDAESFLRSYNTWCNEECFAYAIYEAKGIGIDEQPEEDVRVASRSSLLGSANLMSAIQNALGDIYVVVSVIGDAKHLWKE